MGSERTSEENEIFGDLWMIRSAINAGLRDFGPTDDFQISKLLPKLFHLGVESASLLLLVTNIKDPKTFGAR